jgi:hypothetical protein
MENITCELNGIKYLQVDYLMLAGNLAKLKAKIRKYDAIFQGISKIDRGNFFINDFIIYKILVPEKSIIAWNRDTLNQ